MRLCGDFVGVRLVAGFFAVPLVRVARFGAVFFVTSDFTAVVFLEAAAVRLIVFFVLVGEAFLVDEGRREVAAGLAAVVVFLVARALDFTVRFVVDLTAFLVGLELALVAATGFD